MKEFCALRAKTYTYLMDDDNVKEKAKGIKKCVIKRWLLFEKYKDSLFNDKAIFRSQQRFKSDHHNVYTEEVKYQHLINEREGVGIDHFNNPKAFIEYSDDMCNVYKNIDDYNSDKENKILIVFDYMIADMINKKLNSIVTKLFIRGRKLNISLVFITQSYFKVHKDVRLNTTHFYYKNFK